MSAPLAYFLTWTTYGTWLHGDKRGSIDEDHNRVGTPVMKSDPAKEEIARNRLAAPVFSLDSNARQIVRDAVLDHAAHNGWKIRALNVRTNHVHVVVDCREGKMCKPERVMLEFKTWGTRRLKENGHDSKRVWTDHGSTRWINHESGLVAAVDYVTRFQ